VYSEGEYQEFEETLDGEYTGVGLSARRESDGRIEVTELRSGSPADNAGIHQGDLLRSVDGADTDGRPVTEVVSLLRGDAQDAAAGTTVRLGLERGTRAWSTTVRRARLSTDSVTVRRLTGNVTVIKVAVTAASAFLDGGLVATYDIAGEQHALHAPSGGDITRPLVALVDGGTMSAAEMLTGALQDRGRAVVVGSRTFGKGSIQMPTRLPDGSVAELTVGHYRTPFGHTVDGRGITPDLVSGTQALQRARTVLSGLGDAS
jgi:carboxyl-terminal processing protease